MYIEKNGTKESIKPEEAYDQVKKNDAPVMFSSTKWEYGPPVTTFTFVDGQKMILHYEEGSTGYMCEDCKNLVNGTSPDPDERDPEKDEKTYEYMEIFKIELIRDGEEDNQMGNFTCISCEETKMGTMHPARYYA